MKYIFPLPLLGEQPSLFRLNDPWHLCTWANGEEEGGRITYHQVGYSSFPSGVCVPQCVLSSKTARSSLSAKRRKCCAATQPTAVWLSVAEHLCVTRWLTEPQQHGHNTDCCLSTCLANELGNGGVSQVRREVRPQLWAFNERELENNLSQWHFFIPVFWNINTQSLYFIFSVDKP